jgi:hypothetical protein
LKKVLPWGTGIYATKTRMMINDLAVYAKTTTKFMKDAETCKSEIKEVVARLINIIRNRMKLQEESWENIINEK